MKLPNAINPLRSLRRRLALPGSQGEPFGMLILGAVVGLCGGAGAIGFHWLIETCQSIALRSHELPLVALGDLPWFWPLVVPAAGGLLVGPIVYHWAAEARGHGVPEVMEAVQLREGVIRPRVAAAKSIASAITIGTGGSVGREGPVVQIGAALGSILGQVLRMSPDQRRMLVGCGASAGIAATFNAPIAGAFFSLEVILANFAISTFSPIVLSAVVATAVSRAWFGNNPAFEVPIYHLASWAELLPYALLGLVCAATSVFFTKFLYASEDFFDRLDMTPWLKPALGGLLLGVLIVISPHLYGSGFASVDALLHGDLGWRLAAMLVGLKLLACTVTLASGGSGGVFSPSLFLGAAVGYTFGHVVSVAAPELGTRPEAFALVGMGAFLGGATHAPVTAILILFELTSDYEIILPLMLATTMSTIGARALMSDSIYTRKLRRKGIRLFGIRDDTLMGTWKVRDVMRSRVPTTNADTPLSDVLDRFLRTPIDELFVVDTQGRLVGSILLHDVKGLVGEDDLDSVVIASDLATSPVSSVAATSSVAECLQDFAETGRESLPVVSERGSQEPVGIISRKDVINLYDREVLRHEMLGTVSWREHADTPPLPVGHRLERVPIPEPWAGSTLRDLDLRGRTGCTVLGIVPADADGGAVSASPDRDLRAGDTLVVFGAHDGLLALHRLISSATSSGERT